MENAASNLNAQKQQLLLEWKKLYSEALIDALRPSGDVLQIGFGHGFSADRIQTFHPKTHTIIESHPQALDEARKWASKHANVTVIEGKWNTALAQLGTYDAIFFDAYPLEQDLATLCFLFPEETGKLSLQSKALYNLISEQMSKITNKFSDRDIEDFYQQIGQFNPEALPIFFQKLKDNQNISETQYENVVKKCHLDESKKETAPASTSEGSKKPDDMRICLEDCLKSHMKAGSRFSCFVSSQNSKYGDSQFFENIITNPSINYSESSISIKMSDRDRLALLIRVEKA